MFDKISETIIKKVNDALLKIRTEYPEAYRLLDEDPITLISDTKKSHTETLLENYLNGLDALLESWNKQKKVK